MTETPAESTLTDLRAITGDRASALREADDLDELWRAMIRLALVQNHRVVDIAEAAEISRERVYQIRDGRR